MTARDCNNLAIPRKKLLLLVALGLAVPIALLTTVLTTADSVFIGNFESNFSGWKKELCCSHSAQIVSSPTRAGKQAVQITLKKSDPIIANSKRAELKLGTVPANSEKWYRFSIFLPFKYKKDPSFEIVTQWRSTPDKNLGEIGPGGPPLYLITASGNWKIRRNWDSKGITTRKNPEGKETINLGSYQTGVWTDFLFHVKWSHKSNGLLEVWKNDELVVRRTGPNTYNDKIGPYFKLGIYKPEWVKSPEKSNTTQRVIYFDEIRLDKG